MQHSVEYAMAIRQQWLHPSEEGAREALREVANQIVGTELISSVDLFPRAFAKVLGPPTRGTRGAGKGDQCPGLGQQRGRWRRPETSVCNNPVYEAQSAVERQVQERPTQGRLQEDELVGALALARKSPDYFGATPRAIAWRAAQPSQPSACTSQILYFLVLDLEGKDEIIEFPVIAIDAVQRREVSRFQRYVRPTRLFEGCPLSPNAPGVPFPTVLEDFDQWLQETFGHGLHKLGDMDTRIAILTCGDWDCKHVHTQCNICHIPTPGIFCRWVNIKRSYNEVYGGDFRGMKSMLARLNLLDKHGGVKHGFHHLGMHDVENICRCLLHLLERSVDVTVNGWHHAATP